MSDKTKTHTTGTVSPQDAATKEAAAKVVDATADAIKTAAVAQPAEAVPPGDGSLDNTPTATQVQETAKKPLDTEGTTQTNVVRHDFPAGAGLRGDKTTIKEELRILDSANLPKDENERISTMAVLARTQGINQGIVESGKTKDGKKGKEVFIVYQDGTHSTEFVPEIPEEAEKKAA